MNLDKKTAIIIVIALIGFISFRLYIAFNANTTRIGDSESESGPPSFPVELPAAFEGTLPCASCPGIETHLLIRSDSFREVNWYHDREDGPFTETGEWQIRADTLILNTKDDNPYKQFLTDDDQLRLLSKDGSEVTGDLSENYVLNLSAEDQSIRRNHANFREQGVTFLASGNEPFWTVRVYGKDSLSYITPERELSGTLPEVTDNRIISELESGDTLRLDMEETYCRDSMSGFLFTHRLDLHIGERSLKGCGRELIE